MEERIISFIGIQASIILIMLVENIASKIIFLALSIYHLIRYLYLSYK